MSANQLAKDTGIRQQNLSRWLRETRNLSLMESNNQAVFAWTVEQKARLLAGVLNLTGEELTAHLEREGVKLAEFEQWRLALEEGGRASTASTTRTKTPTGRARTDPRRDRKGAIVGRPVGSSMPSRWCCSGRTA